MSEKSGLIANAQIPASGNGVPRAKPTEHSSCRKIFGGIIWIFIFLPLLIVFVLITLPLWIYWAIDAFCFMKPSYLEQDLKPSNNNKRHVLIFLPSYGFDPSEASLPWKVLTDYSKENNNCIDITFATPNGEVSSCDINMLNGYVFGLVATDKEAIDACNEMMKCNEFLHPISFDDIKIDDSGNTPYDGVIIPGGHDPQVSTLLNNKIGQMKIEKYFKLQCDNKPIGAICHGVGLLSRSYKDGRPLIYDKKLTCVCAWQERFGWLMTFLMYGPYHLSTTDGGYLETEVRDAIGPNSKNNFIVGSTNPLQLLIHGTQFDHRWTHVVEDGRLITARFPGDAWIFGKVFLRKLYE